MKSVFALMVGAASALQHGEVFQAFSEFQATFNKDYSDPNEFKVRMAIFAENMEKNEAENAALVAAGHDAVNGITQFMDLSATEFKAMYLMNDYEPVKEIFEEVYPTSPDIADIDWRTKGALTKVKDQGQCGSCWAFSATAAIESYAFLAGKGLTELSPQQINSCDKHDGGCNGGNTETAYRYVVSAGGIETEASYPYTSGRGQTGVCHFDSSKVHTKITGYKKVSTGETNLGAALMNGPVSVCLAAESFQRYHSGILTSCAGRIDHCVQTVGQTSEYWVVRNSWGTGWGEKGFIRIKKGGNLCEISNDVTYPTF